MVGGWWDGLLFCPREKVVVSSCSNNDNYEVADCDDTRNICLTYPET